MRQISDQSLTSDHCNQVEKMGRHPSFLMACDFSFDDLMSSAQGLWRNDGGMNRFHSLVSRG